MTSEKRSTKSRTAPRPNAEDFISPDDLADLIRARSNVRILDVRFTLADGPLHEEYLIGHIPGALFVDLDADLAGSRDPAVGSYPLPSIDAFERSARSWGLHNDTAIVVYAGYTGISAGRLSWLLRWFGHDHVRVLDGGLQAWAHRNYPLVRGTTGRPPQPGAFAARPPHSSVIDAQGALEFGRRGQLVDVRARGQFHLLTADHSRGGRRPGRIPGAINIPSTSFHRRNGMLRSHAEIHRRLADEGIDTAQAVGVYCGGGVASAWVTYLLRAAGIDAALFASSWAEYAADRTFPVEVESALVRC